MTKDGSAGQSLVLHASCVALNGRGVVITGPSGAGKSALALNLMALGATLVADDRTRLRLQDKRLLASAPAEIAGLIEARYMGLLSVMALPETPVDLVVDLGATEASRLPPRRRIAFLGHEVDLVLGSSLPHLAPALICWLRGDRRA